MLNYFLSLSQQSNTQQLALAPPKKADNCNGIIKDNPQFQMSKQVIFCNCMIAFPSQILHMQA